MASFMQHAFSVIDDTKHRLGDRVWIEYIPTEHRQDEWGEFICQHASTHADTVATNYMTFSGAQQYEHEVQVCDDCDEVLEWDEVR